MPEIKTFKGIFYNQEKVKIADVVTPPYDVISSDMQENFYNQSEYNIVRLILGKEYANDNEVENRYSRAATYLNKWLKEEILVQDKEDSIYYLEETFYIDGLEKIRKGFIALAKLENFNEGNILPHEKTMLGPKADRLNLTKACRCNFSQIFSVYSDEKGATLDLFKQSIANKNSFLSLDYEDKLYKMWKVTDKTIASQLQDIMKNKKIFIADGHHRYETALAYRDFMKKVNNSKDLQPYDYVMMYFSPIENNDLLILPTHRGVKDVNIEETKLLNSLKEFFDISKHNDISDISEILRKLDKNWTVFGMYAGSGNLYILKFKNEIKEKLDDIEALDVEILQKYIFEKFLNITQIDLDNKVKIEYIKNIEYGINLVKNNKLEALFILNPTKIEQVKNIALSGKKMPQKSTYFYPKLITGLVIYKIE